jgi:hypothetical protein
MRRTALQKQVQGQKRTEQVRGALDDLNVLPESGPQPGAGWRETDLGAGEDIDGDEQLQDDGDSVDIPLAAAMDASENPRAIPSCVALADVIGSRPPVVLFHLREEGGVIRADLCAAPSPQTAAALEELHALIESTFAQGLPQLTQEEREQLLGIKEASVARRLVLLARLAVKGGEKIEAGTSQAARLQFRPNDRGLERYASKFAALPDGMPFSLRLLLLDLRGRKGEDSFFDRLPLAIKLLALRRALEAERRERRAVTDYEFGEKIQRALEDLLEDRRIERPTEDQVRRRLRDNLKRSGLGNVFPKREERQLEYDRLGPVSPSSSEKTQ